MKIKIKILLLIVLGIAGYQFYIHKEQSQTADKGILISGTIEATEVHLSFQVTGKILEILTDEGQPVRKGEVLAKLDTEELAKIKNQSEAALEEAKLALERREDDYHHDESLFKAGSLPENKMQTSKTERDIAKAKLDTLRTSLELSNLRLGYAELHSPLEGVVLVRSAEVGEVTPVGATVLTVADLKNAWLTGYVNETDLGRIRLNQEVKITTDSDPAKIHKGHLSFISQEAEFTPKHIQTKEERTKLVYRVKIVVDNAALDLKPGMPADARFEG